MKPEQRQYTRRLWWLLGGSWFALWHLFATCDVWKHPTTTVPGPLGDNIVMLWNLGWVRYALSHGDLGFWFPNAYYPEGFLFLFSTHTWLDGVLGWLASPLLPRGPEGIVLWANIVQLFATTATGVIAMAALQQLGVRRWQIQLLGATAITFCWFRTYSAIGHYHFYGTQWMLAALLAATWARRLLRAKLARQGLWWSLGSGALIGLTFLNDQIHSVFAAILFALTIASLGFAKAGIPRSTILQALFLGTVGAVCVSSIHLIPILRAISAGQFTYRVAMLEVPRLVDASSILLPPDRSLLGGKYIAEFRADHQLTSQEGPYLGISGYLFLLCGVVGSLAAIRQKSQGKRNSMLSVGATFSGCVFLLCAFGEFLTLGPTNYMMLPGRLLRHLPVLNNIRLMERWIWPAQICLTVAGTCAISCWWSNSLGFPKKALLLTLAILAAFEGRWYPPAEPTSIRNPFLDPPGLVDALKKVPKTGGVLVMPMEKAYAHSNHLQFLGGYDIPMTTVYTARAPFNVTATPWNDTQWTPESSAWLRSHKVCTVVFHEYEGTLESSVQLKRYADWIRNAREAQPGIIVLNRNGRDVGNLGAK